MDGNDLRDPLRLLASELRDVLEESDGATLTDAALAR